MVLEFQCNISEFIAIEQFFFKQEYKEKPPFEEIKLFVDNKIMFYKVEEQFGKWYITTN